MLPLPAWRPDGQRPQHLPLSRPLILALATVAVPWTARAADPSVPLTWDNSSADSQWSTATNWDKDQEPSASSVLTFPGTKVGPILLSQGEQALNLSFIGNYSLNGGSLALPAGGYIQVGGNSNVNVTLATALLHQGDLTKRGSGTLTFGPGFTNLNSVGHLIVELGAVSIASDASLGVPANEVLLAAGDASLKIAESFASDRRISSTSLLASIWVAEGREFTLNGRLGGLGTFNKTGRGTMTLGPAVDSGLRGSAPTVVADGRLRIQGLTNLSASGPLTVAANTSTQTAGIAEFLRDEDSTFPYPVVARGGTIHVDRSPGGSTVNGRHTLGPLSLGGGNLNTLRVTGDHGYGLSFGALTLTDGGDITNLTTTPLLLGSVSHKGNPGHLTLTGLGGFQVQQAIAKGSGTAAFGLTLTDTTLRLGSADAVLNGQLQLNFKSLLDLNGCSLSATRVTMQASSKSPGQQAEISTRVDTGANGVLQLGGPFYSYTYGDANLVTGRIDLGLAVRSFYVGKSILDTTELTIDGPITGGPGSGIIQDGGGALALTGAGNTFTGSYKIIGGEARFGKSSGLAVGAAGLDIDMQPGFGGAGATLLADEQIADSAPCSLRGTGPASWGATDVFLDIGSHTETIGSLSLTYAGGLGATSIKTAPGGKLVLNGNLSFYNNTSDPSPWRGVLISGSGSLDLGGAVRTVHVTGNVADAFAAGAAIHARVTHGGIIKTGPRTLTLTNPANDFSGGIEVREGFIAASAPGTLGSGPVTFANPSGVPAGYDFSFLTSDNCPDHLEIPAGGGAIEIRQADRSWQTAELPGGITLHRDFVANVLYGRGDSDIGGTLDISGVISDGSSTFGLVKKGDGTLKLGPANAYSGSTSIQRGTLWITADGSLGDGDSPLLIDGGRLRTEGHVVLSRDLSFTANGGTVFSEGRPGLELSGDIDWGSGTTAFIGHGTMVISGSSSGGSANLQLGWPTAFAADIAKGEFGQITLGLRGDASLPSGNLSFHRGCVLELGNGDFTRPLGTGPGQFQMPYAEGSDYFGGGWAAYDEDRHVNAGGAGATLVFGQENPPFLFRREVGTGYTFTGTLVFGSKTATHTLIFDNPLGFPREGIDSSLRQIEVIDGPAAVDVRLTGDFTFPSPGEPLLLEVRGGGTADFPGDLRGNFTYHQYGGRSTFGGGMEASELTNSAAEWIFGPAVDFSSVKKIVTDSGGGTMDVTAIPGGMVIDPSGSIELTGGIYGNLTAPASLSGTGLVNGNLFTLPHTVFTPGPGAGFTVNSNFNLVPGARLRYPISGPKPLEDFPPLYVGGTVTLQGRFEPVLSPGSTLSLGDSLILLNNLGDQPIQGTFENLPEGAVVPIGNGLGLQVSYHATSPEPWWWSMPGNDFGVTVVPLFSSGDVRLSASAPLSAGPGDEMTLSYALKNSSPGATTGTEFQVQLPAGVTFLGSEPPGTLSNGGTTFTLSLPAQAPGTTANVVIRLAAPAAAPSAVHVAASYHGSAPGDIPAQIETVTAILPGNRLAGPALTRNASGGGDGDFQLSFETIAGVRYVYESSTDLHHWTTLGTFLGTGEAYTAAVPYQPEVQASGYVRLRIVP